MGSVPALDAWIAVVRSREARRLCVLIFCIDASLTYVFLVALQSYFPSQRIAGLAVSGLAFAAFGAGKLLAQYEGGRLVDRVGANQSLTLGLVAIASSIVLLLGSRDLPWLVVPASAVYGSGSALVWPALLAQAHVTEERARSHLAAVMTLATGGGVGAALVLALVLPERFPFLAALAIALGLVLVALVVSLLEAPSATWAAGGTSNAELTTRFVLSGPLVCLGGVYLLESAAIAAFASVFGRVGHDFLAVSLHQQILLLLPAGGLAGVGILIAGSLGRWAPPQRLLVPAIALTGLSLVALAAATSQEARMVLLALTCFGLGLAVPLLTATTISRDWAGPGEAFGLVLTCEGIGHIVGPALASVVSDVGTLLPAAGVGLCGAALLAALFAPVAADDRGANPLALEGSVNAD